MLTFLDMKVKCHSRGTKVNKTCVCETDVPCDNKVKIWQNLLVLHYGPPHPQGHVISGSCEQPLHELTCTVQVCNCITTQT